MQTEYLSNEVKNSNILFLILGIFAFSTIGSVIEILSGLISLILKLSVEYRFYLYAGLETIILLSLVVLLVLTVKNRAVISKKQLIRLSWKRFVIIGIFFGAVKLISISLSYLLSSDLKSQISIDMNSQAFDSFEMLAFIKWFNLATSLTTEAVVISIFCVLIFHSKPPSFQEQS